MREKQPDWYRDIQARNAQDRARREAQDVKDKIEKALRDYPVHIGNPHFQYGLDDLDFADTMPTLAAFIYERMSG